MVAYRKLIVIAQATITPIPYPQSMHFAGYGDSEGSPTEGGIVNDTRVVYDYVRMHSKDNAVVVWGHSMGTG